MSQVYGHLRQTGSSHGGQTPLTDFSDLTQLMGFDAVWDFEKRYADPQA
jgi:hypothetical protein